MARGKDKKALVLAGGGIMGAAYEIGALAALDRLFAPRFSVRQFDMYIGVSAGAVIATLMANRMAPADLFRIIARNEGRIFNWRRSDIYRLDGREIFSSCWQLVRNLLRIFRNYRRNGWTFSFNDFFFILQEQFPAGLFSLGPMQNYLCRAFRQEGVLDDFNQLKRELYIPAYDLDRGRRVVFGEEGYRQVHICQAVTASCAIPYFFRPHKVAGSYYSDGSIGRVTHLDVAIEKGARLIVVVNPRVPVNNDLERFCLPSLSEGRCSSIAELGITYAWEQAMRIENKEKLDMALEIYRHSHPHVDIVLLEPGPEETALFFQTPMSFAARNQIMNYGYNLTLGQLRDRYAELEKRFARHGVLTSTAHLNDAPPAEVVR